MQFDDTSETSSDCIPAINTYKFSVLKKTEIAEDTFEIQLGLDGNKFSFVPGQYVHIVLPEMPADDPGGNGRDFSLVSSPNNKIPAIAIRTSGSGYKQTLLGERRVTGEISGPFGRFTLPKETKSQIVFLAGGIGITPFLSILRYVVEEKQAYRIALFYGNSRKERVMYQKELQKLENADPNIKCEIYFERLDEKMIRKKIKLFKEVLYYIAGPPIMVSHAQGILKKLGIDQRKMRVEEFSGYKERLENKNSDNKKNGNGFSTGIDENVVGIRGELAKRSLTDLEALLQTVSKAALISETNAEGIITFANDKFVEVSKYSREELIGQNHRLLKSGHHPKAYYVNLWETITRGRLWRGLLKNKAKDGSFYWVDTSIAPIIGPDGKPAKYISVRFPITDRQQAEEKLQQWATEQNVLRILSQKALSTFDLSSLWDEAVLHLSQTMRAEFCAVLKQMPDGQNLLYEAGTGFKNAEKGKTLIPVGSPETMGSYILSRNQPVVVEDIMTESRFDGTFLMHDNGIISGVSVIIQGQESPFGILDVYTARRRIFSVDELNFIQSVANLLANAARNHLDKRKDEFLGIASHEMKTPLTSIKTFTQLLQRHANKQNDEHAKIFLVKINWQIDRLSDLINDLLDISRINSGKVEFKDEEFLLDNLVEEIVNEQRLVVKQHKIILQNGVKAKVYGDKYRIGQVVTNLLTNAAKYSPESDKIIVKMDKEGREAVVLVKDFGVGIPKDEQPHIFDRFYQGNGIKREDFPGGLGLGLFIASNIVKRHSGQIGVNSEEGKGSEFFFTLPVKK